MRYGTTGTDLPNGKTADDNNGSSTTKAVNGTSPMILNNSQFSSPTAFNNRS